MIMTLKSAFRYDGTRRRRYLIPQIHQQKTTRVDPKWVDTDSSRYENGSDRLREGNAALTHIYRARLTVVYDFE